MTIAPLPDMIFAFSPPGSGLYITLVASKEIDVQVPLSNPDITNAEIEAVVETLKSTILSFGPKLLEFEEKFAKMLGVRHAVSVCNGTAGLHLCMRALDIGPGDEVITTPFSFVASTNCFLYERAKPVFVDIEPETLNLDVNQIEAKITSKTKAILPVHVFGHPCEIDKVMEIGKRRGLPVIEDACEAIGAEYHGQKAGTFGAASVFAFYPNKQMTTGEGGIIATNDDNMAKIFESLRNQGRADMELWLAHPRLGYNYRLTSLQAALGVEQLNRLPEILEKRARVAGYYEEFLGKDSRVVMPKKLGDVKISWFVYVIQIPEKVSREKFMLGLRERGIGCRPYFSPIHLQAYMVDMFGFKKGDFPVTERVSERTVAIPFFTNLSREEARYVSDNITDLLNQLS